MQKWEYTTVELSAKGAIKLIDGRAPDYEQWLSENKEIMGIQWAERRVPNIQEYLATLGQMGWELVGVDKSIYSLKRPTVEPLHALPITRLPRYIWATDYWKAKLAEKGATRHKEILRELRYWGRQHKQTGEAGKIIYEAIKEHLKDRKDLE